MKTDNQNLKKKKIYKQKQITIRYIHLIL